MKLKFLFLHLIFFTSFCLKAQDQTILIATKTKFATQTWFYSGHGNALDTQKIKEKYNEIVNIFANIKEKFSSVGKNIVEGIKNGIASSWKAFYDYLEGLFGDLIEFVKKLLKIQSPSKVFRDEIGQWIPAGIGVGIEKGMDSLKQKAAAMKDELLDGTLITNAQVLSSTKYEPDTSSMASQSVVINNNIKVDGAADPEAWTQTFIRSLKREARMA